MILSRGAAALAITQTPLGTAAFRNSLVSPRWTSLHPQPRSRVFCSIDRFVSRHDFGLGFDKACSRQLSFLASVGGIDTRCFGLTFVRDHRREINRVRRQRQTQLEGRNRVCDGAASRLTRL
jgi:hypothetical protein